jgi:hypothetical protein
MGAARPFTAKSTVGQPHPQLDTKLTMGSCSRHIAAAAVP